MKNIDDEDIPILGFLQNMFSVSSLSYSKYKSSTINVVIDLATYEFNVDRTKKDRIVEEGYEQTITTLKNKQFKFTPEN